MFSGSYAPCDVQFLLKLITTKPIDDLQEKERLIQSGERHYSEMISPEMQPSERYISLFRQSLAMNGKRMASDLLRLASAINEARPNEKIVLVSLVRAGTPVGVLLRRLLEKIFNREVAHYSVSIIRDRGLDWVALSYILNEANCSPVAVLFVDGWTGKGVISRELAKSVAAYNAKHGTALSDGLYVLSDLAGCAEFAASNEDYLIPSSILNSTVSGLVSRSILNEEIGPYDFHGCLYYQNLESHDMSRFFVDTLTEYAMNIFLNEGVPTPVQFDKNILQRRSKQFMVDVMKEHGIQDPNLVKPGIGEATRVLLRRVPKLLLLRDSKAEDVEHLKLLAEEKKVEWRIAADLPYSAVALVRSVQIA